MLGIEGRRLMSLSGMRTCRQRREFTTILIVLAAFCRRFVWTACNEIMHFVSTTVSNSFLLVLLMNHWIRYLSNRANTRESTSPRYPSPPFIHQLPSPAYQRNVITTAPPNTLFIIHLPILTTPSPSPYIPYRFPTSPTASA